MAFDTLIKFLFYSIRRSFSFRAQRFAGTGRHHSSYARIELTPELMYFIFSSQFLSVINTGFVILFYCYSPGAHHVFTYKGFLNVPGDTPRKGGGLRSTSQNPYSISDQNPRFLLSPWPKIRYPIYDCCGRHSCPKHNLWRALKFVAGLINNDEKVASSKKHTRFKTRVLKPKWPKSIPYLWPKRLTENHTLWGRT